MQIWALSLLWASGSFVQYLTSIYRLLNYYEQKQKAVLCSWCLDANKGCRHASNDHRNNRIIVGYDKGSEENEKLKAYYTGTISGQGYQVFPLSTGDFGDVVLGTGEF